MLERLADCQGARKNMVAWSFVWSGPEPLHSKTADTLIANSAIEGSMLGWGLPYDEEAHQSRPHPQICSRLHLAREGFRNVSECHIKQKRMKILNPPHRSHSVHQFHHHHQVITVGAAMPVR